MIDSHSHIYLEEFDADRSDVVARARQAGVRHLVLPNVDLDTVEPMMALHRAFPAYTSVAMGLHPTSVGENFRSDLAAVKAIFDRGGFVAVGEVGIDLYWDKTYRNEQIEVFDEQLRWAERTGLPVIIHCREGLDEILWTFDNYGGTLPKCVFHSFGGTVDDVEAIRRRGDFLFRHQRHRHVQKFQTRRRLACNRARPNPPRNRLPLSNARPLPRTPKRERLYPAHRG